MNFRIHNEVDHATIDIIGAIGESWFDEGNTLKTVRNQVKDLDVPNIYVNISSMGGDLMDGLAIHDLFKTHPAKITAKIIGSTASAATIIALGADEVQITENSRFLIHNATTMTVGNADDHSKTAEQLISWDNDIVNIYQKATGKRKSEIRSMMKEERFITSDEALKWGFVNKIIKEKVKNQITNGMNDILKYLQVTDEAEALIKIKAYAKEITELKETNEAQALEVKEAYEEIDKYENARIEAMVANAITAGKITEAQKEKYMKLAEADFETTKSVIDEMNVSVKLHSIVNQGNGDTNPVKKDYDWYMKNDAGALIQMMSNDPDKYNEIIKSKSRR